jgi:ribokinase
MKEGKKIVVIGSSNTDMIVKLKTLPKPGETVIGGHFSTASGGKGANQAVAAARAGGNVVFVCKVGSDSLGETALRNYSGEGIDIAHASIAEGEPSGVALIFVDEKGENSIAVASGANAKLLPEDILKIKQVIADADILLMQLEIPIETVEMAAEIAYEHKVKVILNPAPAQALSDDLLSKIALITPNETEAEILTGKTVIDSDDAERAAKMLLRKGVGTVIITMGAKGAYLYSEDIQGLLPAYSVQAADTTAAGDVFNGALAVSLADGNELDEAIKFATAASALSVTKSGAQPSIPNKDEITRFIKTH